jgi:L-amino acid N-acyltransferase YncA
MNIRLAHPGDLPAINEIYNQAVGELFCTAHLHQVDMDYRREWFSEHDPLRFPVYVYEERGSVLGWISLGPYRKGRQALDHVGEVSYYVHRLSRGRGIGKQMLEHVIRTAPQLGLTVLVAILLDRNSASISLLEKEGFTRWGAMPGIARIGHDSADHLYYGLKL